MNGFHLKHVSTSCYSFFMITNLVRRYSRSDPSSAAFLDSRYAVQSRGVVPEDFLFDLYGDIGPPTEFYNRVRKVTVTMRVVGCEDDSIRPNDSSRMCQPVFVGLARNETTFAPDVL